MPNCPKCNSRVTEAMSFCPSCGASLKAAPPPAPAPSPPAPSPPAPSARQEKQEKQEKGEKQEKTEKGEKQEKRAFGPIGPIVFGVVLIMVGLLAYARIALNVTDQMTWAYFFVIIGIVVILAAIYGAMTATRRHPPA